MAWLRCFRADRLDFTSKGRTPWDKNAFPDSQEAGGAGMVRRPGREGRRSIGSWMPWL